jgi:catechol 2,3-dioxygenase-like lactoylglutathione lyase family enzyme
MYIGSGVHHVAIGVRKLDEMKAFYRDVLGFGSTLIEFEDSPQEMMQGIARANFVRFAMIMFSQEPEGTLIELTQMNEPVPKAIRRDRRYGDIGVAKTMMAVHDIDAVYNSIKDKVAFCSAPKSADIPGFGEYRFVYGKDPEGNLVEFFCGAGPLATKKSCEFRGAGIAVTDLDRSVDFYQELLGFDRIVLQSHDRFSGLVDEISGSPQTEIRSCMLANSNGGGMVELFEVTKPRGRSIPFGTRWGDFGFLQVCVQCSNNKETMQSLINMGIDPLCDFYDKEGPTFVYMKDLDGTPVELLSLPLG